MTTTDTGAGIPHVTLSHTFETAHRLPHLGGKCTSLHGHSWQASFTLTATGLSEHGTVVEFGQFKRAMRGWIDTYLDHGTMLGTADPLRGPLRDADCKVFVFGEDYPFEPWPTVEAVARLLARQARFWLSRLAAAPELAPEARILRVDVAETAVNTAGWTL